MRGLHKLSALLLLLVFLFAHVRARGAGIARFTFGTPESVTRGGFTKVTVHDAFTPEKGYGFQDTHDLLAYDRGGSAIERPKDEYTASVYGAYRTTSSSGPVKVALLSGSRMVAGQARQAGQESPRGAYETRGLKPDIYTLEATLHGPQGAAQTARRQIILAPDPFDVK